MIDAQPEQDGPRRPQVGVSVAVWRGESVLLVRRGRAPEAGYWTFPGGHVEFGETLRDAARRELREETAVDAEIGRQLGLYDLIRRPQEGGAAGNPASGCHAVLVVFAGTYLAGEPRAGDDAADARWFLPGEIEALSLTAETRDLIRTVRGG